MAAGTAGTVLVRMVVQVPMGMARPATSCPGKGTTIETAGVRRRPPPPAEPFLLFLEILRLPAAAPTF